MEKQCCQINVTELDNGYRYEITGEHVKDNCKPFVTSCCTENQSKAKAGGCC